MKDAFVSPSDPVLMQVAESIDLSQIHSDEVQEIIQIMLDVAYGNQKDRSRPLIVGLAAPQIGISKRIILVDLAADGKGTVGDLKVFINPEIIWKSSEQEEWYEGCFSTDRVCGIVSRPKEIKIKAYNESGNPVEQSFQGYSARIVQHEIDHLDGIEFTNYITDESKLHWVDDFEFPQYRDQEAWRSWPNKCPREKWEKIKGIAS